MGSTSIEWTDFSVNPIRARRKGSTATKGGYASGVGHYCEKMSPGCRNCYASTLQPRFGLPLFQEQRNGDTEVFFDASKLEEVLRLKKPARIFWCDMTDMFGRWVPNEWIAACFGVMAATPHLTHQVLTKRADRLPEWFAWAEKRGEDGAAMFGDDPLDWRIRQMIHVAARRQGADLNADRHQNHGGPWPLPNVHLGVSVENQGTADERIPRLLSCPAAIRWISAEPLLEAVDLERIDATKAGWRSVNGTPEPTAISAFGKWQDEPVRARLQNGIDWVVVGGESGPGARPFNIDWARALVGQCRAADVPAFVKQLGSAPTWDPDRADDWWKGPHVDRLGAPRFADKKGGDMAEWPVDLRVREFPRVEATS